MTPRSNESRAPSTYAIIEWRAGGHRLAYVRAIADAARSLGFEVRLITTTDVVQSAEASEHLEPWLAGGSVEIHDDVIGTRGLGRLLRQLRRETAAALIPEADKLLPWLLAMKLLGRLPSPLSLIVMRPPQALLGTRSGALRARAKTLVLLGLRAFRGSIDLRLLEDPLAGSTDRAWKWPFRNAGLRLDDPDLVGDGPETRPVELSIDAAEQFVCVIGALDGRKRLDLVAAAWSTRPPVGDERLILAGRVTSTAAAALATMSERPDVTVIDRYIGTDEMRWLVAHCAATIVLYDGGFSSGVLTLSARRGCRVITGAGTRPAIVASRHGFAIVAGLNGPELRRAIDDSFAWRACPSPVRVPTAADFGTSAIGALARRAIAEPSC